MTPKQAREAVLLTQEELAFKANLSVSTIVKIERRGSWPSRPNTRCKLAVALGLNAADLLATSVTVSAG